MGVWRGASHFFVSCGCILLFFGHVYMAVEVCYEIHGQ